MSYTVPVCFSDVRAREGNQNLAQHLGTSFPFTSFQQILKMHIKKLQWINLKKVLGINDDVSAINVHLYSCFDRTFQSLSSWSSVSPEEHSLYF